jgi:hypothetical protein
MILGRGGYKRGVVSGWFDRGSERTKINRTSFGNFAIYLLKLELRKILKDNHHIMAQPKVLIVLTSADKMPTGEPTGWWLVCLPLSLFSSPFIPFPSQPQYPIYLT